MNKKLFEEWLWDEQKKIDVDQKSDEANEYYCKKLGWLDKQTAFNSGRLHEVFEVRKVILKKC